MLRYIDTGSSYQRRFALLSHWVSSFLFNILAKDWLSAISVRSAHMPEKEVFKRLFFFVRLRWDGGAFCSGFSERSSHILDSSQLSFGRTLKDLDYFIQHCS